MIAFWAFLIALAIVVGSPIAAFLIVLGAIVYLARS